MDIAAENRFKVLIYTLIALDFIFAFISLQWSYFGHDRVLNWVGEGALFPLNYYFIYSYAAYFITLVIYLGLYNYKKWARPALLWLWLFDSVITPFSGIYVFSGFEMMIFKITLILTGLLIGLVYFSELTKNFGR
ncbi:hypothetical protein [Arsukibacterium sp.]|uniref:hypothetical protein n=1 Tax=Arsukibacterium sp. TaxID=1977258 RepID=UPI00299CFBCF|nr:hypothetical protein [Arsukibacterium sp.]MDX1537098.1 hypothetical protein [Arsukibacterium sp.]